MAEEYRHLSFLRFPSPFYLFKEQKEKQRAVQKFSSFSPSFLFLFPRARRFRGLRPFLLAGKIYIFFFQRKVEPKDKWRPGHRHLPFRCFSFSFFQELRPVWGPGASSARLLRGGRVFFSERKTYSEEAEIICVLLHFTMRVPLPIRIRPEIYAAIFRKTT